MASEPKDCVELLQKMVSIKTVNRIADGIPFVEGELIDFLEATAGAWGFETQRLSISNIGCNLLVSRPVNPNQPWLLFDSHLDTVGVEGMTIDPFAGEIRDGKLYGRGSCDTKGTGSAMLWALKTLAEQNQPSINIAILFSIEEEISRTGITAFVQDQLKTLSWTPQAVVVGEPTSLKIVAAHNGTVRWQIETSGTAAHSSNPTDGHSAISDMVRVIAALESEYIPQLTASYPLVGKAQCSINLISGGSLINVIPDSCTISVDRRIVPGEDGNEVLPAVQAVLDSLREQFPDLLAKQKDVSVSTALPSDGNHELCQQVGNILRSLALDDKPVGAKYGTHASDFAAAGLPAIVLGPGDIAQAHREDEFIEIASLQKGIEVYQQIMSAETWKPA